MLILCVILAGCDGGTSQESKKTISPMPITESARELRVVISGDTQGWIIPCGCTSNQSGGLLRRATYVHQLRAQSDLIIADCGGAADGTAPYQHSRFRAILLGEKVMGLEAHNVGAAEAAFGAETLKQLSAETGVTFLSANVRTRDGDPALPSHKLIERSGLRVLITGVCSPALLSQTELSASEPGDAILSVLTELAGKFDRLIVLAWLPVDELRKLAENLPEADAIIGGPTGQSLPPELIGRVLLTSATNKGKFVATLTIPSNRTQPVSAQIMELSPVFSDDENQKENLDDFRELLAKRDFTAAESGLARSNAEGLSSSESIAGTESCRECHGDSCAAWDASGHSHAWERLVIQKANVDPYCQQCHTTGYGLPDGFSSIRESAERTNVGCESCHGPSESHVMDSRIRTPIDAVGSCLKCHDPENSPQFDFDDYWERIRHD